MAKAPKMDDLLGDPRWAGVFLPSLAHALYISRKPFKHFKTKSPEFLEIAQEIFDLSQPNGFLQTKLLAATAQKYLRFADKSVLKPEIGAKHPPKALYALMLVAVCHCCSFSTSNQTFVYQTERAFRAYLPNGTPKSSKELEEFSDDNFAREVNTFMGHINKVSERRWQVILDDFHQEDEENDFEIGDVSLISEYRANIFIPSSPIKG
jgi:hypothetical protein